MTSADLITFPSPEVEFIIGPQLKSGNALNPAPWFDSNAITKGIEHGEAFPADPSTVTNLDDYINLNYYDQALVQYINFYRTGDERFRTYARKIADSWWKASFIGEGRTAPENSMAPRNISLAGLMLRAMDGRPEMWPWITSYTREHYYIWVERPSSWWKGLTDDQLAGRAPRPQGDQMITKPAGLYFGVRDGGYMLLHAANLARVHPDAAIRSEFRAKVLDGAVNYYARTQRVVPPADGGFYFELPDFGIEGLTTQPFQEGILAEGLIAVHRLTGDGAVKTAIVRLAEHLYNRAYSKAGWRAFYYFVGGRFTNGTSCEAGCGTAANPFPPSDTGQIAEARQLNPTALHTFGYAYALTGDPKFKQWGDEVFDASFSGADGFRCLAWGRAKEYDEAYRSTGDYLAWRGGAAPPAPSPTPTPAPTPAPSPTPAPTPSASPTPTPSASPTPSPTSTSRVDTLWVDDEVPDGAILGGDGWNWVSASPAPSSGSRAHQSALVAGSHQHYFTGATQVLAVNTGETLITYVYLDPSNPPSEIMLQWNDGSWEHRAYWGANSIALGANGTDSRRFMGALPAAGQWVRLEVPASLVGLEGRTLRGMAFTLFGGRATWDRAGKSSSASAPTPTPSPTPSPTPAPSPTPPPGQARKKLKDTSRDAQNLINELQTATATEPSTNTAPNTSTLTDRLNSVVASIQQTYNQFDAERGLYTAAPRIEDALTKALDYASRAATSAAQQQLEEVMTNLRRAIDFMELADVRMTHGDVNNAIDYAQFFVRQHYVDFLGREPDEAGRAFWAGPIETCGAVQHCAAVRRIDASAAFFLSIEFQETGYLVYRLYRGTLNRTVLREQFLEDTRTVGAGVMVGAPGWVEKLAANKRAFYEAWVLRTDFRAFYGSLTNTQYVDRLFATTGVVPAPEERDALIADLGRGVSRAEVLARIIDGAAFRAREFNRAFVLMQYFGYLQRDPDPAGLEFWLQKLNNNGGDFRRAEMVRAFLDSIEYRERFSRL